MNPVDRFCRNLDRFLEGLQNQITRQLIDYTKWFAAQAILDAFAGKILSIPINIFFLLFTGYGFWQDFKAAEDARKSFIRFLLAIIAFGFDIWLNFTIA